MLKIRGGVVFIGEDDRFPQVLIEGSNVVIEGGDDTDYRQFLGERLAPGSQVVGCNIYSTPAWAAEVAKAEAMVAINRARTAA